MAEGKDPDGGKLLGRMAAGLLERFGWRRPGEGIAAVVVRGYLGLPAAVDAGVPVALVDGQADAGALALADLRATAADRQNGHALTSAAASRAKSAASVT